MVIAGLAQSGSPHSEAIIHGSLCALQRAGQGRGGQIPDCSEGLRLCVSGLDRLPLNLYSVGISGAIKPRIGLLGVIAIGKKGPALEGAVGKG